MHSSRRKCHLGSSRTLNCQIFYFFILWIRHCSQHLQSSFYCMPQRCCVVLEFWIPIPPPTHTYTVLNNLSWRNYEAHVTYRSPKRLLKERDYLYKHDTIDKAYFLFPPPAIFPTLILSETVLYNAFKSVLPKVCEFFKILGIDQPLTPT